MAVIIPLTHQLLAFLSQARGLKVCDPDSGPEGALSVVCSPSTPYCPHCKNNFIAMLQVCFKCLSPTIKNMGHHRTISEDTSEQISRDLEEGAAEKREISEIAPPLREQKDYHSFKCSSRGNRLGRGLQITLLYR